MAVPGIALAVIIRLTVREPQRSVHKDLEFHDKAPGIKQTFAFMWSQRSLRHLMLGGSLLNLYAIVLTIWMPAFMVRSHDMTVREASEILAILYGLGGVIGLLGGGYLTDYLGRKQVCWHAWVTVWAILLTLIPTVAIFVVPLSLTFYIANFIFGIANYMFLGPLFAMTQNLVSMRMRAMASALLLFMLNLIGQGIGPLIAGFLSDMFAGQLGQESLRYALLIITIIAPLWGMAHYLVAARTIEYDYRKAESA